jgi:hypothetical protein
MGTLTKSPYLISGWGTPKIDLSGCVLYLPLWRPDMAGTTIISKDRYAHSCTVTGALWRPNGRWFDGVDDYVDCGPGASLKIPNTLTLEAWLYQKGGTINQFSIGHGQVDGYKYGLIWCSPNAKMAFAFHNGVGWGDRAVSQSIPLNTWVHVAGVWDGSYAEIYINGGREDRQAVTGTIPYVAADRAYLGYALAAGHWWNGLIGEVRIYNRALTALEIQNIYLKTKWRYR